VWGFDLQEEVPGFFSGGEEGSGETGGNTRNPRYNFLVREIGTGGVKGEGAWKGLKREKEEGLLSAIWACAGGGLLISRVGGMQLIEKPGGPKVRVYSRGKHENQL